jgi:hypothetical protein
MMDVSNGIFVLSQSQKASIVEGVGQDIDLGPFKLAAESIEATDISVTGKAELNQLMLLSSTKELTGSSSVDIDVSVVAAYIELVDDVGPSTDPNAFTLSNGVKGQIVVIKNTDSHTATVGNVGIVAGHTQMLVYDGTDWESLSTPSRRRLDSISATSAPESSSLGEPLFSDKRLKKNIRIIENASEKLQKIRGVTYYFDENLYTKDIKNLPNTEQIGVIAQEVEKVLPQLVTETDNGIKKVDYSSLTALLIQVNKEQEDKILSQEIKIQKIERNQIFLTNLMFMFCALIVLVILIFGVLFIINNKGTMQEERKM